MDRKTKRWCCLWTMLMCVFVLGMGITVRADTENTRTVRVAFPRQDGMSYFQSDGTPAGYNYTYMEKLSEYTGWKIEYVPYNSGDHVWHGTIYRKARSFDI